MFHIWRYVGQCRRQTIIYIFYHSSAGIPSKLTKMIPNGYLIFEDESFLDSTVAKMNALRKSGQFCDVRLQVLIQTLSHMGHCFLLDFFFQRSH